MSTERHHLHGDLPAAVAGTVFWITGLSGAGKTTVARMVASGLRLRGRPTVLLDGDVLREIFPRGQSTDMAARLKLAQAYSRLCRELSSQGLEVVCATISMFHEVRRWNRENISKYCEVYLTVPQDELRRRDPKGIYARFDAGVESNVIGFDLEAEIPESPDMTLANHGQLSAEDSAEQILRLWSGF